MSCAELRELIPVEIAGLLEPDEWSRVGAHLAECGACREERERLMTLLARVPEALGDAPAGAWDDVAAAIMNERVPRQAPCVVPKRWRSPAPGRAAESAGPLPALRRLGPYEIVAMIGQGSVADMYRARHLDTGELAVLRVVTPGSQRNLERLRRQARQLAGIDHPNVVRCLGSGEELGIHWTAFEEIEGEDLEQKLQRFGRCAPEEAATIVLALAEALARPHALGLVHQDLKAECVLVDPRGQVRLTDFGLGHFDNGNRLTMEGAFIGTPLYMAPEVGRQAADARVDVYSLGVLFYYLLTGVQPFREFSGLEILRALAHEKLRSPRVHVPELPDGHVRVLARMLATDRDRRYASCRELIVDLQALLEGRAPLADQPGPWGTSLLPPRAPARWRGSRRASQAAFAPSSRRQPEPAPDAAPLGPFALQGATAPPGRHGPFELLEEIGRGGSGAIYRARHVDTGELVALKAMPLQERAARSRARLEREASAMARVEHPGAIRVLGTGTTDGWFWIAMELVEGETLAEKLRRFGPCSPAEAGEVVLAVAQALAATHAAGLVHRDLKPDQVLVDGEGRLKLIARLTPLEVHEPLTCCGAVLGTPYYMAPEMLIDPGRVDGRSDLFSLGVVFYELLTGQRPFRGETAGEVVNAILTGKMDAPTRLVSDLPDAHRRVLARMLATKREHRYQSAAELVRDLEALREGRPVQAPPVPGSSWWRRLFGR